MDQERLERVFGQELRYERGTGQRPIIVLPASNSRAIVPVGSYVTVADNNSSIRADDIANAIATSRA
jgi:hypothetical protein